MDKNIVYVTTDLDEEKLWSEKLYLKRPHWIDKMPEVGKAYKVRSRHGGALLDGKLLKLNDKEFVIKLAQPLKAAAPGQSAVVYDGDLVLGGGIIN